MLEKQQKPIFLNLLQISMPVTAIVSVLHRLTGLLLVLLLPVVIYGFYLSTQSSAQYDELMAYFDSLLFKISLIIFIWAIAHHVFAGIRFLLIDIDIGISLPTAKKSAWLANIAALIIALWFAWAILL